MIFSPLNVKCYNNLFYYYRIGIKLVNIQLKGSHMYSIIAVHVCHLCVIHRLIMHESIIKSLQRTLTQLLL